MKLFSDRFGLTQPRVKEELETTSALALIGLVNAKIGEHWFGLSFPVECNDGRGNAGCDGNKLSLAMDGYNVIWPGNSYSATSEDFPQDYQVFDLLEFSYEYLALPESVELHSFRGHYHYNYDQDKGREQFAGEVNRIFERQGLAFELAQGEVTRIAPTGLQEALAEAIFRTGDAELDRLLETAREKFLNRSLVVRKEGLEKLWDGWERLKTIEPGKDKKAQTRALLDKAATEQNFRKLLDDEALLLTGVGNNFMIRHTETPKTLITESAHVDYLFHRMFAIIRLLLKSSGRGG